MSDVKRLMIKLVRSLNGCNDRQKACVRGLGLRRMHHSVYVQDTPCNRGMINRVIHMLTVEEVE